MHVVKKISSRYILIICVSLIIISVILFYSIFDQAYHSNAAWAYAYLWVEITLISSSLAIILLIYEILCFIFQKINLKRLLISFFIIGFTLLINIYGIPYIFNHLNTNSLDGFLSLNGTKYKIISITNQNTNVNPSIELYLKDIQMKETDDIIGFVQDFSLIDYKENYQRFDQLFGGKVQLMLEFFSEVDTNNTSLRN